jgi:XTP/dITP diphosphohydrolase
MKIIAATKNKNKLREFGEILKGFEIISQEDAGIDIDVEETGTTFEENSFLKAKAIYDASGIPAIADDSGLCVDALGGEPGVYSARYGGEGLDDTGRWQLLLKNMEGKENRACKFVSVICCAFPDGTQLMARGEVHGVVAQGPKGEGGFGYDPIFWLPQQGKSMAELTAEEKNKISHRGNALRVFKKELEKKLNGTDQ